MPRRASPRQKFPNARPSSQDAAISQGDKINHGSIHASCFVAFSCHCLLEWMAASTFPLARHRNKSFLTRDHVRRCCDLPWWQERYGSIHASCFVAFSCHCLLELMAASSCPLVLQRDKSFLTLYHRAETSQLNMLPNNDTSITSDARTFRGTVVELMA